MTRQQIILGDVAVGTALPELVKKPTSSMLFRFSAVTWNAHRIHYDQPYARLEGHDDILVQATMHGAFLLQMVTSFAGPAGRVLEFSYSNRGKASPGDILTLGGTVTAVHPADGSMECDIWERNQRDQTCAIGAARVCLPTKPVQPAPK